MISVNIHCGQARVESDSYGEETHAARIVTEGRHGESHTEIIIFTPTREIADEVAAALRKCFDPITKPEFAPAIGEEEIVF